MAQVIPLLNNVPRQSLTVSLGGQESKLEVWWQPVLNSTPRQSLTVSLGGQESKLEVWWQPSDSAWYASLESPVGTPVASGRRLVKGGALIARQTDFVGDIYVQAVVLNAEEPALDAWGNTFQLVYA